MSDLASALSRKAKFHELLAQSAASTAPTPSWGAALARALQGGMAGMLERGEENQNAGMINTFPGMQAAPPPSPAAPAAATQSPAPPSQGTPMSDGNMPRGYRNNNPLNIETGQFTQGQPGFSGSDGRFAKFASMDQGAAAANKLLDVYQNKHGLNTVAGIVGRWAPTSDGNNVSAYAANVSKQLGIDPNAPVPPEMRPQLISAMAQHENGRPMPQMSASPQQAPQRGLQSEPTQTRQPQAIPPEVQQQIRTLWANPQTRDRAIALYDRYSKPPSWDKLDDSTLYDKDTGRTMTVGNYRSLTDPAERSKFGIPANDPRPYQLGPAGKLINPPAETRLTVDQRGESKFKERASSLVADRFNDVVKAGMESRETIGNISALKDIGSRITTGKTAEIANALGPWANMFGIDVANLPDLQAYQAIVSKLAPTMRAPGSGATSDFEMRQFLMALPSLGKTPAGNEIVSNTLQAIQEHRIAAGEIGSRAMAEEITPREAEKQLRELPDPMQLWKSKRGTLPTAEAVDQLKTKYGIAK